MSTAHALWLTNLVLGAWTLVAARDFLGLSGRWRRAERGRFLHEVIDRIGRLPDAEPIEQAWRTILKRSNVVADTDDACIAAICVLEGAGDAAVDTLRKAIEPHVNLMNDVAEFIDQGLVRPKDIARSYPAVHATLLNRLAIIAPFIWYESILQGRGRWGYRVLRLKTIFERLRPVSPRDRIRGPRQIEIEGTAFLSLSGMTWIERAWGVFRLWVRSPTINVRSKVAQARERDDMESKLTKMGVNVSRAARPGKTEDW